MDRKQFLKAGLCSGVLTVLGPSAAPAATPTPCEKKQEFAEHWIVRLMDAVDHELDPAARARLMEANGRACYRGSRTPPPAEPGPAAIEKLIADINRTDFASIRRDGGTLYFTFTNPGHCYCPIAENQPKGLSATYCECSVGYMKEKFRVLAGKEPKVELLEAVLRGGERCRFKIEV